MRCRGGRIRFPGASISEDHTGGARFEAGEMKPVGSAIADKANPAKRIRVAIFFIRLVNWFAFGYWLKWFLRHLVWCKIRGEKRTARP